MLSAGRPSASISSSAASTTASRLRLGFGPGRGGEVWALVIWLIPYARKEIVYAGAEVEMSYRNQIACALCGPLMTLGFFVGLWLLADFIMPPSPSDSAAEIAAFFSDDTTAIRAGLFVA